MTHVRGGTSLHGKFPLTLRSLSDAAFRLHIEALCWSDRNGCDLMIDRDPESLKSMTRVDDYIAAADELVTAGVWRIDGDDYDISDPKDRLWHQPTARIKEARRARDRDRRLRQQGGLNEQVMERDGWRCVHCGTADDLTVDHKFPQILGGSCTGAEDDMDNLQTLCRPCNARKGVTVPQ